MFRAAVLAIFLSVALPAGADEWETLGRPAEGVEISGTPVSMKVDLAGAKNTARLVRLPDGSLVFLVKRLGPGTDRLLTPDEFARLYYEQKSTGSWWMLLFNITGAGGIAWVVLGLGGQLLFTGRMLVQWLSSEREKRSVVPESFWWMSLIGATMLLVYFIWRRDIVGILGQATGWIIYIRNLVLIRQTKSAYRRP